MVYFKDGRAVLTILELIFLIVLSFTLEFNYLIADRAGMIYAVILLIDLVSFKYEYHSLNKAWRCAYKINAILQIIIQPIIFVILFRIFLSHFILNDAVFNLILKTSLLLLAYFLSEWSLIKNRIQVFKGTIAQLIVIFLICLGNNQAISFIVHDVNLDLTGMIVIHFINLVMLILLTGKAMVSWKFKVPGWKLNPNVRWWALGILCLPLLILNMSSWGSIEALFVKINLLAFLVLIVQVIFEEWLFRFVSIDLITYAFKKKCLRDTVYTMIISGLLFGFMHFGNLNDNSSLSAVFFQVSYASLLGIILAGIYFYSGTIWLPIILHFVCDFLGGAVSTFSSKKTSAALNTQACQVIWIDGILVVFVLFALWHIAVKGQAAIEETISKMK